MRLKNPRRVSVGDFSFAYISLPSGNMNPTRAFAPRASAICCHSSTVNLPVFIRLLSSWGDQFKRLASSELDMPQYPSAIAIICVEGINSIKAQINLLENMLQSEE